MAQDIVSSGMCSMVLENNMYSIGGWSVPHTSINPVG